MNAAIYQREASELAGFLKPVVKRVSARAWLFRVVAFAGLTALAAQVRMPVPGSPVPMTLQSLSVLFAGLMLTPNQVASAMILYLGVGILGAPVFAAHSQGVFGPSGGYLVGFIVAATAIAVLKGRSPGVFRRALAAMIGLGFLFACGVGWLAVWSGGSIRTAALMGFAPFALKGLVEIGVAVAASSILQHRYRNSDAMANMNGSDFVRG